MNKTTIHYIGNRILIKSIRDFIIDNKLGVKDSILLNPRNYDDIILEYRATYKESINIPYYLLRVLIKEDTDSQVPEERIGLLKNDGNRTVKDYQKNELEKNQPDESHKYDIIYRCGWCGNIVDFDGSEFDAHTRLFKIKIHQKFRDTIVERKVNGKCCPNGHEN